MDTKLLPVTENNSDAEFNTIMFEKKLTGLKDSQDSINACCHWCLNNRQHHKKIVCCWLNVLKRVKIEHRLTLFYLANDVIQYSKRRNYDFVESWGTTLQKATTMVRDEKVKHKILRIFKIWEQRGVYGEEFLTDLCGLISASPSARKGDETHEFQSAYLIQKIKACSRLETDTDTKLKQLKEHNPKIQIDSDTVIASLKDRAHVDDVEKEVEDYTKQMENYINALKLEIKARINLISLLSQAETQLENDKKDVKLVTTAYKTFATRVKTLKKKLDEKVPTLASPVPSPDINAPSPSPDSDIELHGNDSNTSLTLSSPNTSIPPALYTNPGYYNPVPPPNPEASLGVGNNSFSSFMGSNMSFDLSNISTASLFDNSQSQSTTANITSQPQTTNSYNINDAITSLFPSMVCPPPPPAPHPQNESPLGGNYQYNNSSHVPLLPPPMPPFSKSDDSYSVSTFTDTYNGSNNSSNYLTAAYEPTSTPYQPTTTPSYQPTTTPSYQPTTTSSYQSTPTYQPTSTPYEPTPQTYQPTSANLPPTTTYEGFSSSYPHSMTGTPYRNPEPPVTIYPPPLPTPYHKTEEYNPEEELETWEPEPTWEQPPPVELDTPESPPMFEKEGYGDPVEYHDANVFAGATDVDHRVLPSIISDTVKTDQKLGHRTKDVDHRNLISLTGSPSDTRPAWVPQRDQDYRKPSNLSSHNADQDYRVSFNMENFKLPPPPPPPKMVNNQADSNSFLPNIKMDEFAIQKVLENVPPLTVFNANASQQNLNTTKLPIQAKRHGFSPRKLQDNTESIDMDLSDDDHDIVQQQIEEGEMNMARNPSPGSDCFELPPPFPDLLDDVDANKFLDNVNEDLEEFDTGDLEGLDHHSLNHLKPGILGHGPILFPMNFPSSNPVFNEPPPIGGPQHMLPNMPPPEQMWMEQDCNEDFNNPDFNNPELQNQEFQNREFPFRGRGNNTRGNFNNRPPRSRGTWGGRGTNDFKGRGGRGVPWVNRGVNRGNMVFRGNRGVPDRGGNWNVRGRAVRGWGDGGRGRGDLIRGRGEFRGSVNFRGNFRGGF